MNHPLFSYSIEHSLHKIQVKQGNPDSISLRLLGVDDEMANTMLVIEDGNERIHTIRPEPAMVHAIEEIAEDGAYVLYVEDWLEAVVELDDGEVERFEEMAEELERAVEEEGRIN